MRHVSVKASTAGFVCKIQILIPALTCMHIELLYVCDQLCFYKCVCDLRQSIKCDVSELMFAILNTCECGLKCQKNIILLTFQVYHSFCEVGLMTYIHYMVTMPTICM